MSTALNARSDMFTFGVDYYPEHWLEERWTEDVRLMVEAGVNTVRLAEFAWSKLEPEEGNYNFSWLDQAIDLFAQAGIRVVLGTPTASAPPWLMGQDAALYRVGKDGVRATYGHRRAYCPSHPLYHRHTEAIVTRMAEHYRDHPAVIGWQIDNEFMNRCYCAVCRGAFQSWLEAKYGDLQRLNEAWGTVFWSHVYNEWHEVPTPLTSGGPHNPGLALDFLRFASDTFVSYQALQLAILRKVCSNHFVTHNFMGFGFREINYFDLAKDLDLVTWDSYPRGFWNIIRHVNPSQVALAHDTMRGLKDKPFWLMEQQSGAGGWDIMGVTPRPGEVRLWAYQAIAHGADGMIFFRWRTARFGAEQYWHGLLNHDGSTGRRYQEVKQLGLELKATGNKVLHATTKAEVAMILSYDTRFAFEVQANNPSFDYPAHFQAIYQAFHQLNVVIDIVPPDADLSRYRLVIAPALHIVDEPLAQHLTAFVAAGGTLMVTPRTGVKEETNAVVNLPLPGHLASVCGVTVEEYDSLAEDMDQRLNFLVKDIDSGQEIRAQTWCDILSPTTAEIIASYTEDYYRDKPAITLNTFGKGKALYVGTVGNLTLFKALAGWVLKAASISPFLLTPPSIEITERRQDNIHLLFVLNHSSEPQELTLCKPYVDLLSDRVVDERTILGGYEVLILIQKEDGKVLGDH